MRSIKHIAKGEEILNDYGQLPRSDLLRRYGFVTENYSHYDVAEISTQSLLGILGGTEPLVMPGYRSLTPLSQEESKIRVELAERENVCEDSYDLSSPSSESPSIPDELLALLYLLLLDDNNLTAIETSKSVLPSRSKLATRAVGQVLVAALQRREMEYASTLEEDTALLQCGNLTKRQVMAIQVRLGEKWVLKQNIREAKTFSGSDQRMRAVNINETGPIIQNSHIKRRSESENPERKRTRFR